MNNLEKATLWFLLLLGSIIVAIVGLACSPWWFKLIWCGCSFGYFSFNEWERNVDAMMQETREREQNGGNPS